MADKKAVKDLKNSEKYEKIREDLLDQLDRNGTYGEQFKDLVQILYSDSDLNEDWFKKYKDDPDFETDPYMVTAKEILKAYNHLQEI